MKKPIHFTTPKKNDKNNVSVDRPSEHGRRRGQIRVCKRTEMAGTAARRAAKTSDCARHQSFQKHALAQHCARWPLLCCCRFPMHMRRHLLQEKGADSA